MYWRQKNRKCDFVDLSYDLTNSLLEVEDVCLRSYSVVVQLNQQLTIEILHNLLFSFFFFCSIARARIRSSWNEIHERHNNLRTHLLLLVLLLFLLPDHVQQQHGVLEGVAGVLLHLLRHGVVLLHLNALHLQVAVEGRPLALARLTGVLVVSSVLVARLVRTQQAF